MTKSQQFLAAVTLVIVGFRLGMKSPSPGLLPAAPDHKKAGSARGPASATPLRLEPSKAIRMTEQIESKTAEVLNMPFHEMMNKCHEAETKWRKANLDSHVAVTYALQRGLDDKKFGEISSHFFAQMAKSKWWRSEARVSIDGSDLTFYGFLEYSSDDVVTDSAGDYVCWHFYGFSQQAEKLYSISNQGSCGLPAYFREGNPVTEFTTYDTLGLGSLVSAVIFPLDTEAPESQFEYLGSASGQWSIAKDFKYQPVSQAAFDNEYEGFHSRLKDQAKDQEK